MNLSKVKNSIMQLPVQDRTSLALWIIINMDDIQDNPNDIDSAWRSEIRKRVYEIKSGKVNMIPSEELWKDLLSENNLNINTKYYKILNALGGFQEHIEEAIKNYAQQKISERIVEIQGNILEFQSKFGLPYEKFYANITTDEAFVDSLRQLHPTWEHDFNTWEYYVEELYEWLGHLESILKK